MSDYDLFTIEAVTLVCEQSNVNREGVLITYEQSALALIKAHGNLARAVLNLTLDSHK